MKYLFKTHTVCVENVRCFDVTLMRMWQTEYAVLTPACLPDDVSDGRAQRFLLHRKAWLQRAVIEQLNRKLYRRKFNKLI